MRRVLLPPAVLLLLSLGGCFWAVPSKGGGQISAAAQRRIDPGDIALLRGYRVDVIATGLTYPTSVTFDEQNRPHVLEGGYSYGEDFQQPRLVRIESDGRSTVIVT